MRSMERWQEAERGNAFLIITRRQGRQEPFTPLLVTSRMQVSRAMWQSNPQKSAWRLGFCALPSVRGRWMLPEPGPFLNTYSCGYLETTWTKAAWRSTLYDRGMKRRAHVVLLIALFGIGPHRLHRGRRRAALNPVKAERFSQYVTGFSNDRPLQPVGTSLERR